MEVSEFELIPEAKLRHAIMGLFLSAASSIENINIISKAPFVEIPGGYKGPTEETWEAIKAYATSLEE